MNHSIYKSTNIAAHYIQKGYAVIPIKYQTKKPFIKDWQNLKITESDLSTYFNNPNLNVAVVLGKASNGLIDIDLDDPIALKYADHFLPKTIQSLAGTVIHQAIVYILCQILHQENIFPLEEVRIP